MRVNLRAAAVGDVLATRGVDRRRMFVEGMVAAEPVADDSTPEGRRRTAASRSRSTVRSTGSFRISCSA